jgi:GDP-4-dehydro-6-deoxy-D-mannose reductase
MLELPRVVLEPKIALVTGATGFAGRQLIHLLSQATPWQMVGVARRACEASSAGPLTFRAADLTRFTDIQRVLAETQPDYIFHLAAALPPARDEELFQVNVGGAVNLLEAVTAHCPQAAVLIVGSDAQYGAVDDAPLPTPETAPLQPRRAYGRSKVLQEKIAQSYARMNGLHIVCVRPFNYIGPGQSEHSVIASIARQIAQAEQGRAFNVIEMGRTDTARDFTDVRDVVYAFMLALLRGKRGAVYNIGSGISYRIAALADALAARARVPVTFRVVAHRTRHDEVLVTQCEASRLRRRTGWTPQIPIEKTLADTLDDWRARVTTRATR